MSTHHSFPVSTPLDLDVSLGNVDLHLSTHAENTASVEVEGPDADSVSVNIEGSVLVISMPGQNLAGLNALSRIKGSDKRTSVKVRVPAGTRGAVGCGSGDILVDGDMGELEINAGASTLSFTHVTSSLEVSAGASTIALGVVDASTELNVGASRITVCELRSRIHVSGAATTINIDDLYGQFEIDGASSSVTVARAHEGTCWIEGFATSAKLGIMAGVPVFAESEGLGSRVDSNIAPRGKPAPGQAFLEVHAEGMRAHVTLNEAV